MEPKHPEDKAEAVPLLAQSNQIGGEPVKDVIILTQQRGGVRAEVDSEQVASQDKQCPEVKQYLQENKTDLDIGLNSGKFFYSYLLLVDFDHKIITMYSKSRAYL